MDLMKLVEDMTPEEMEMLMGILPLVKEKAELDRAIAERLAGDEGETASIEEKPAAADTKPGRKKATRKKATRKKATRKKATRKKAASKKAASKKAASKKAKRKKAATKKASASTPKSAGTATSSAAAKRMEASSIPDLAVAYLKGKKDAPVADIVQAVADAKGVEVNKDTKNSFKASIYRCDKLKRTKPGRFALAK